MSNSPPNPPICTQLDTSANDFTFTAPRWLQWNHAQTVLASLKPLRPSIHKRSEALLAHSVVRQLHTSEATLEAHVSLQGSPSKSASTPAPLAVLLHGWEGSHNSLYLMELASYLFTAGYSVARLNFRDHGGTHALNPGMFHSNRLQEAIEAVAILDTDIAHSGLALCGFSLGGNFALRIACHAPESLKLAAICAVCPVINPVTAMPVMDSVWLYRSYFIRKWRRSLRAKQAAWPEHYDFTPALKMDSLCELTDYFVKNYTEYNSVLEYLKGYALTPDRIERLTQPAYILAAADDPVLPNESTDIENASAHLQVQVTPGGGHCGYLIDRPQSPPWHCQWVAKQLRRHI